MRAIWSAVNYHLMKMSLEWRKNKKQNMACHTNTIRGDNGRMAWGSRGLPKVLTGSAMLDSSKT
jgi:hypothetical protein